MLTSDQRKAKRSERLPERPKAGPPASQASRQERLNAAKCRQELRNLRKRRQALHICPSVHLLRSTRPCESWTRPRPCESWTGPERVVCILVGAIGLSRGGAQLNSKYGLRVSPLPLRSFLEMRSSWLRKRCYSHCFSMIRFLLCSVVTLVVWLEDFVC